MISHIFKLLLIGLLACFPVFGFCQSEDVVQGFRKISPDEEARLKATLAEPVPTNVLTTTLAEHFRTKRNAADRLGDISQRVKIFEESLIYFPNDAWLKNDYASLLREAGNSEEALRIFQEISSTERNEVDKARFTLGLVNMLYALGRFEEAQKSLDSASLSIKRLKNSTLRPQERRGLLRAEDTMSRLAFRLHSVYGRIDAALAATAQSVEVSREALRLTRALSRPGDSLSAYQIRNALESLARALSSRIYALRDARRHSEMDQALMDFVRFSREETLSPDLLGDLYEIFGTLRLDSREFEAAESFFRRAATVQDALGFGPLYQSRLRQSRNVVMALAGMHRWSEGLAELDRLDLLAKDSGAVRSRMQFSLARGYTYLGAGVKLNEAVTIFDALMKDNAKRLPSHHFSVTEPRGLLGITLWRLGTPESKARAVPLLAEAVRDYMLADNVEPASTGIHRDVRDLVFAAYVDATFSSTTGNPMDAMAPADWIRGGVVQEALADAALRSATTNPELSDLVRQDQDAKNEIDGLRKFLAGDVGQTNSNLPTITANMRSRITQLEDIRWKLQGNIRLKFPAYDKLTKPHAPTEKEISAELADDEALLLLLPTETNVYVWAVTKSGQSASSRVDMSMGQVSQYVNSMRSTLDFGEMESGVRRFNSQASSDLYQKLLGPVESAFKSKRHLIVAAGGILGRIPFSVLLTKPTQNASFESPWLIKQAAITHIPSIAAWLTMKQTAKGMVASEPLVAWGDPQFAPDTPNAVVSSKNATRKVHLNRGAGQIDPEKNTPRGAIRYADIPALPETREELLSIASALNADIQKDVYFGVNATKESVLQSSTSGAMRKKRVVVFATHGLMAGDLPGLNQPALALAATGKELDAGLGSLLTLDEVLSLKLNADWVILSACNTASGDGKAEEALSGLARGFFYAGSRSLLVTHWAVESESAKMLTTGAMAFYAGNPTERKAESLRRATLNVMAMPEYQHPAYWAPYALVGDGGR